MHILGKKCKKKVTQDKRHIPPCCLPTPFRGNSSFYPDYEPVRQIKIGGGTYPFYR